MNSLQEFRFGIVGIKRSGLETALYLLTNNDFQNVKITLFDDKPDQEIISQLQSINPDIECFPLRDTTRLAEQTHLIVSPGISTRLKYFNKAKANGVDILGDIELFARIKNNNRDQNFRNAKVIGITGSNGKTTVTELTTAIINHLGYKCTKAGNVGIPILSTMKEAWEVYVLELSSYQLETTSSLRLDIGTILNISDDHLDRYESRQDYAMAKHRIYDLSTRILYNKDDPATYPTTGNNARKNLTSFSSQNPKPASYFYDDATKTINFPTFYNNKVGKISVPVTKFKLRGRHNYENILAAIALVRGIVTPNETIDKLILDACYEFTGLAHRYELVHKSNNNVTFINDSKATNIGSVISAIKSTDIKTGAKLYLLLGGDGKKQDFTQLSPYVQEDNINVVCYGRDAELVAQCNPDAECFVNGTLEAVMKHIIPKLNKDDIVLLSPGCASFDQFKNYEERGKVFTAIAKKFHNPSSLKRISYKTLNFFQQVMHKVIYFGNSSTGMSSEVALYDRFFLAVIFSIYTLGILTVISSSVYLSVSDTGSVFNYKQILLMVIGVLVFISTITINSNLWRNFLPILIFFTVGMLLFVQVTGHSINGAQRWIKFAGFTFQPVELAKLTTLIYLAHYLVEMGKEKTFAFKYMFGFGIYMAIVIGMMIMQPDFGSSLMLIVICGVTVFLVTPQWGKFLLRASPIAIAIAVIGIYWIMHNQYIVNRLTSFSNPFLDEYGKSYQTVNSLAAYANGDITGTGLGNSIFKSGYLTEANTDYILAIFSEEFGFLGIFALTILEILLFLRMFKIAHETYFTYKRQFQAILTFSFIIWFAWQTLYNFNMTVSFLPTDGSTFPLISYGGSSYVVSFIALGIILRTDYENRLIARGYKVPAYRHQNIIEIAYGWFKTFGNSNKDKPKVKVH